MQELRGTLSRRGPEVGLMCVCCAIVSVHWLRQEIVFADTGAPCVLLLGGPTRYQIVSPGKENFFYPFGGKPSKAREPLLWTDQPTNDQGPTTNDQRPKTNDQGPTAEDLKYSRNRARQH